MSNLLIPPHFGLALPSASAMAELLPKLGDALSNSSIPSALSAMPAPIPPIPVTDTWHYVQARRQTRSQPSEMIQDDSSQGSTPGNDLSEAGPYSSANDAPPVSSESQLTSLPAISLESLETVENLPVQNPFDAASLSNSPQAVNADLKTAAMFDKNQQGLQPINDVSIV